MLIRGSENLLRTDTDSGKKNSISEIGQSLSLTAASTEGNRIRLQILCNFNTKITFQFQLKVKSINTETSMEPLGTFQRIMLTIFWESLMWIVP
jgi:hypothetical protein